MNLGPCLQTGSRTRGCNCCADLVSGWIRRVTTMTASPLKRPQGRETESSWPALWRKSAGRRWGVGMCMCVCVCVRERECVRGCGRCARECVYACATGASEDIRRVFVPFQSDIRQIRKKKRKRKSIWERKCAGGKGGKKARPFRPGPSALRRYDSSCQSRQTRGPAIACIARSVLRSCLYR